MVKGARVLLAMALGVGHKRHLTASKSDNPQVLTLARPDETSIPAHAQHFESKEKHEKIFPGARNFR